MGRHQAGLAVIETLMPVLRSMQEHRGASRSMLAGDASFKPRVERAAGEVGKAMQQVQSAVAATQADLELTAQWNAIQARWGSLAARNAGLEPAVSFREHTALIAELLRFFPTASNAAQLESQADEAALKLTDALIDRLPRLSETTGQTRGFGAGLLSRQAAEITPRERATLIGMVSTARILSSEVSLELAAAGESDLSLQAALTRARAGLEPIAAFLNKAENQVALDGDQRPVAGEFFEEGTRALKGVFEAHSLVIPELRKHLQAQSNEAMFVLAITFALVVLVVLVALALGLMIYRRMRWALGQAVEAARSIAQGRLDIQVPAGGRDEFGQLLEALRSMTASLQKVVSDVRLSANEITVAVGEVSTGNADLSQRTESQAANLQQTSSSMEELTSTVANNAANARQANQLAVGASEVARRGGEVVEQVVSTMSGISESSRRIADIIGVIDGIAFQTNILALNAAVEAARAGEQGRGFAVVASEVRSLAQRSAEAAREIKGLITDSVQRVSAGETLVRQAGETMSEVVVSVSRVTDIIGEISSATSEQSSGIALVNSAVTDLDRMTQQNAALVEQGAAASESLMDQARKLLEAINQFRVDGGADPEQSRPEPTRIVKPAAVSSPARKLVTPHKAASTAPLAQTRVRSNLKTQIAQSPTLEVSRKQALPAPGARAAGRSAASPRPDAGSGGSGATHLPSVTAQAPAGGSTLVAGRNAPTIQSSRAAAKPADDDWEEF